MLHFSEIKVKRLQEKVQKLRMALTDLFQTEAQHSLTTDTI